MLEEICRKDWFFGKKIQPKLLFVDFNHTKQVKVQLIEIENRVTIMFSVSSLLTFISIDIEVSHIKYHAFFHCSLIIIFYTVRIKLLHYLHENPTGIYHQRS